MTELKHIEIEGFKGLEHIEFEPTDINLITGRNNTGKTSFLEAVDLLFNPANLQDFGDNLDSVIHIDSDCSEIMGETEDSAIETALKKPSAVEAGRYFSEAVPRMSGYQMTFSEFVDQNESKHSIEQKTPNSKEASEDIEKLVDEILEQKLTQDSMAQLRNEILVLSTSSTQYPCFLGGEESTSIMQNILEELAEELIKEDESNEIDMIHGRRGLTGHLDLASGRLQIGLPPRNTFLKQPENTNSATFIKSINLTESIERTDDEQEPIKIDDIGDFLKETGLVDDLKTFTLDYLVFEENGEKYQITYDFMGDGFKSIVGLLWELMDEKTESEIVLLEEPENHMHPGYIREVVYFLIELAREQDIQLFITTHDSDFINDFFTENLTDEEEAYLEEEFSLLRMEEDSAVVEDYETARENLKELHLDLRGI